MYASGYGSYRVIARRAQESPKIPESPKIETPKTESPKTPESPKIEKSPKIDTPKIAKSPKIETPKIPESPKTETPKTSSVESLLIETYRGYHDRWNEKLR